MFERVFVYFGVVCFGDGVFEEGFFEFVEGDYDVEDFGEGVLKVVFSVGVG